MSYHITAPSFNGQSNVEGDAAAGTGHNVARGDRPDIERVKSAAKDAVRFGVLLAGKLLHDAASADLGLDEVSLRLLGAFIKDLSTTTGLIFSQYDGVGEWADASNKTTRNRASELEAYGYIVRTDPRKSSIKGLPRTMDTSIMPRGYKSWEALQAAIADKSTFLTTRKTLANRYRLDRQQGQRRRIIVACEAAGMVPQLVRVAEPFGIPVRSSGGFDSVTAKYALARSILESGSTIILHLGDHDPSGVHVAFNLERDVRQFVDDLGDELGYPETTIDVVRVAITPEQVLEMGIPTAPQKATDNRSFEGIGDDPTATAQAEALPPDVLAATLRAAIESRIDRYAYARVLVREEERERIVARLARLSRGRDAMASL